MLIPDGGDANDGDNNNDSLPGGDGSDPTGGAGAGSSDSASGDAVDIKTVLNELLSKEYKDDETALKSVKETFSTVSEAASFKNAIESYAKAHDVDPKEAVKQLKEMSQKAKAKKILEGDGQPSGKADDKGGSPSAADEQITQLTNTVNALLERDFYRDNPGLESIKPLLSKLKEGLGKPLEEIAKMDEVKDIVEQAAKSTDAQSSRSVIHSSRVGGSAGSDEQKDFEKAQASGDWADFLIKHRGLDLDKLAGA